jgi:leucyl-tRNA synthetase
MYDHKKLEAKWRKRWAKEKTFQPDLDKAENKFYNLMMFPYPSGEGLHVGHTYAFGGADAYGRFKRLQGHTVFEPMGFDAFGIHSENFAIKKRLHPRELIDKTTTYFREKQMKRYAGMWDWSRQADTTKPEYYKWTQWIFVQFFKNGLVERKKASLNWCPSCKTVLSDEQVEAKGEVNVCERCKTEVERKETEQWFFKITNYSERLLDYHGTEWPNSTREMQTNWIGRKEGIDIEYEIEGTRGKVVCFTTRPDTNFGATFVVLAPEHPVVASLLKSKLKVQKSKVKEIKDYVERAKNKSEVERIAEGRKKTGVFTGLYAINQLTGKKMPIWVTDFVLMNVGTGAVVGVPGHDRRDFEFAKEFGLPIIRVVVGSDGDKSPITRIEQVQEDEGTMVNSDFLDGMDIHKATQKIMDYIEEKGRGKRTVTYRLRDWCISRQRYWGPPIPMIYCKKCADEGKSWFKTQKAREIVKKRHLEKSGLPGKMAGWYPVEKKDLPVELPDVKDYQPKGKGKSPLAEVESFYKVDCPECSRPARRETDVSDTFLDSAWYFLRYPSTEFDNEPINEARAKKWLPVDMYIGGNEHACLHLLYSRFVTMALHDLGYLDFEEPFKRFFAHGLIIKDGAKMSKSRGNVVNPEEYMDKYGADALRMYLLFLGPINQGGDFRDTGMRGMLRFLKRLYQLASESARKKGKLSPSLARKLHQTIRKIGGDLEKLRFNTAIAALMELAKFWQREKESANKELVGIVARLVAPLAPHLAEEFWEMSGGGFSVLDSGWPEFNPKLVKEEMVEIVIQVNGKLRDRLQVARDVAGDEKEVLKQAKASERVKKHLEDKKPKKVIFVKSKLVNFVC